MSAEELYSLVEIADLLGTPSTTIRYRAKLFAEFLHPLKRPKHFRGVRYPADDVAVFQLIDGLYRQERSTGDIRRSLEEARDGKVIDAEVPMDGPAPPARLGNGPEAIARILQDGIAQAMAPLNDANQKIAASLDNLHDLLQRRGDGGGGADDGALDALRQQVSEIRLQSDGAEELARLRERVRSLEDENRRLRDELERLRQPLPFRLVRRARNLF